MTRPPIPPGTILQNRYRLLKMLGQGGFGRTYLAEDQARFQEKCVIKEYTPAQTDAYALQKSRELFQREANVLWQIKHPQIPQFHATFEQGKRLFLVQDFVEGPTYSALLEKRKAENRAFSEAEVLHLMQELLPVLQHIHSHNIIHRDISPDNIILRQLDKKPVLIDFGVVKELAGKVQGGEAPAKGTTVGKLGYAPPEQLQTGKASPNSDLYALAVTAIVLMTGREPQTLLDETSMTWHWQPLLPRINPRFAQVLNRMLSPRPQNRYQSATEVAQTLRSLSGLIPDAVAPGSPAAKTPLPAASSVTRRPVRLSPTPTQQRSAVPISVTDSDSLWESVWLKPALIFGAIMLTFMGISALMNAAFKSNLGPSSTPSPTIVISPPPSSPTRQPLPTDASPSPVTPPMTPVAPTSPSPVPTEPSPAPSPSPTITVAMIDVPAGQADALELSGQVSPTIIQRYLLPAQAGQEIQVELTKGAATLTVQDPEGKSEARGTRRWSTRSPKTGNYQIDVMSEAQTDFTVTVMVRRTGIIIRQQ
ncbi:protein kinase domain-containing protein [Trichothermofontia sp.]